MEFWEPDKPIELDNGHLVCGKHRLEVCGKCCVDYTFMHDYDSDEESPHEEDSSGEGSHEKDLNDFEPVIFCFERGNYNEENDKDEVVESSSALDRSRAPLQYREDGTLIVPTIGVFRPQYATTTPQALFPIRHIAQYPRYVHQSRDGEFLIYTDGACLNNGQANPAAGWGFVFRDPDPGLVYPGTACGRLEKEGPSNSGEEYAQTSNRAELRAVIAAFQYRGWPCEGWKSLVIATDSEYVTKGATEWVHTWGRNGWKTSKGTAVKNRDLWEELLQAVLGFRRYGMDVSFWRIPREWNTKADHAAKEGARSEEKQKFSLLLGVLH